jgi:hypothetical protein
MKNRVYSTELKAQAVRFELSPRNIKELPNYHYQIVVTIALLFKEKQNHP